MKRFSIILLGALAIFMAGCSKNIEPSSPDPDAWKYDASLPVPILFSGSGKPATKAGTLVDGNSQMVGKEFGFFAFHDGMDKWGNVNTGTFYDNGISGWKQNMKGEVLDGSVVDGNVQFEFEDGPYYYPLASDINYSFYGYHARVTEEAKIGHESNAVHVTVGLGDTDILWEKATAESFDLTDENGVTNTYHGFNARYIRKSLLTPDGLRTPFMSFKHLTSAVSFTAQLKEASTGLGNVTVNSVVIDNTAIEATLCVAHRTDPTLEGKLKLKKTGDIEAAASIALNGTKQSLLGEGKYLFIIPSEKIDVLVNFSITGTDKSFTSKYTLVPEFVDQEDIARTGFLAGYKYHYNFIVYSPEKIVIEATVKPYEDAFGGALDVNPDNE